MTENTCLETMPVLKLRVSHFGIKTVRKYVFMGFKIQ